MTIGADRELEALLGDNRCVSDRLRSGDPALVDTIVRAYLDAIFRAALGAGLDHDRAEDVTQATFLPFVEKDATFDGRSHVRTWIFGILYKKILEAHRETRRGQRFDAAGIDDVVEARFQTDGHWHRPPEPIDTDVYRGEVRRDIEECIEKSPMRDQLAFVLREVEGFAMSEICNILDVTRTNLGVLLHRTRNRIRECLEAKGMRGSRDAKL